MSGSAKTGCCCPDAGPCDPGGVYLVRISGVVNQGLCSLVAGVLNATHVIPQTAGGCEIGQIGDGFGHCLEVFVPYDAGGDDVRLRIGVGCRSLSPPHRIIGIGYLRGFTPGFRIFQSPLSPVVPCGCPQENDPGVYSLLDSIGGTCSFNSPQDWTVELL